MAFCTECGSKLPEDAVFCPNCGVSISPVPITDSEPQQNVPENGTPNEDASPISATEPQQEQKEEAEYQQEPHNQTGSYNQFGEPQASGSYTEPQHFQTSGTSASAGNTTYTTQNSYNQSTQGSYSAPYQGGYSQPPQAGYEAQNNYGYPPYPNQAPNPPKKKGGLIAAIIAGSVIVLAVIAILVMHFFVNTGDKYIGYWESYAVDTGDGILTDDYYGTNVLGAIGIQINSDNSVYLASVANTDFVEGTWSESKNGIIVDTDNDIYVFTYEDEHLILYEDGELYYFAQVDGDINHPTIPRIPSQNNSTSSVSGSGDVGDGDYYISITGAEDFIDLDGDSAIRIYYDFTNNNDYANSVSAWDVLSYYAYQDGSLLEETYSEGSYMNNSYYYVRPGISIQCSAEFKYDPYGGSVDFSVSRYNDDESSGVVTASYVPGSLPGAPAPYVIVPISDPQWTLQVPGEGAFDSCYISVTDAEIITDYSGSTALRVYFDFTNRSNYNTSISSFASVVAYQDGISLDITYASQDSETDTNFYTDIAPGETITTSAVFLLRNETSPVEAEAESYEDYTVVGQTYNIS